MAARLRRAAAGMLLAAGVLAAVPPAAGAPARRPAPVVAPRVSDTGICDGDTLVVHFDVIGLHGRSWEPILDDGHARLELLEVSGRSMHPGPDGSLVGTWARIDTVSGGEHVLRWPGWADAASEGQHYELARVAAAGYVSVPAPILEECS